MKVETPKGSAAEAAESAESLNCEWRKKPSVFVTQKLALQRKVACFELPTRVFRAEHRVEKRRTARFERLCAVVLILRRFPAIIR